MTTLKFILIFVVTRYYVSLFFHSFFLHRYFTHRQFEMSKFWVRFFWIATLLTQGSSYMKPWSYARLHLKHHQDSDKEGDPHSPSFYSPHHHWLDFFTGIWPMMLKTKLIFTEISRGKSEISKMFKNRKFPKWDSLERFADSGFLLIAFVLLEIIIFYFFCPVWWAWFFIIITLLNGPIQGAIVNWFGHMAGPRRYKLDDNSRNTPIIGPLMLGEANQNNHHADPENPNFARRWYEFDLIYPIILLFNWVRVIKLKKA